MSAVVDTSLPLASTDATGSISVGVASDVSQTQKISLCSPPYVGLTSREKLALVTSNLCNWLCAKFGNRNVNGYFLCPESPFSDFVFIPIPEVLNSTRDRVVTLNANVVVHLMVPETLIEGHAVFQLRYAEVLPELKDCMTLIAGHAVFQLRYVEVLPGLDDYRYLVDLTCRMEGLPALESDYVYHTLTDLEEALALVFDYASGDIDSNNVAGLIKSAQAYTRDG
jgi:hypothetical protein